MSILKSTVLFLFILVLQHCVEGMGTKIATKVGVIKGAKAADGDYSMFLGIPYAEVNKTNPFGPSIPYPRFDKSFEAYDDTAICPQFEEFSNTIIGTLDCLQLNIYVPTSANQQNRLPVLVWIHGGALRSGSYSKNIFGPRFLMQQNILLVTVNYRLGPYGFMCLDTPEVPGNQGLKDQLIALRWIKENIAEFGGDHEKITIAGSSAGGISSDVHLMSQKEPLFNRIVIQSGTALIPALIREPDLHSPLKLADELGLSTDDINDAMAFLAEQDPKLVIKAANKIYFAPCVEKDFENVEKFIIDYPVNTKLPKVKGMDVLMGHTYNEWPSAQLLKVEPTPTYFYNALSESFDFKEDELIEMEEIVRNFYSNSKNTEITLRMSNFDSDFGYNYPNKRTIEKYLNNECGNLYSFVFSFTGGRNFNKNKFNKTIDGAIHCDEIGYLFDVQTSYMPVDISVEDQLMINRMTTLWGNFVKFGNPTPETSKLLPIKWEPITDKTKPYYLDINSELTLKNRIFSERMTFWDLFYKLNGKKEKGYRDNLLSSNLIAN